MKVTSRIKTIFNTELLHCIAAICDIRSIGSNEEKMTILTRLLNDNDIKLEILGGATNRLVAQIDGYAVKFAIDSQGYQDNMLEYSLSHELQPYVTKSYETNGYILIAECVEVLDESGFQAHRYEIQKVLDVLSQDYLLGDVGYVKRNMTNWGLRDGKVVILDYAYCHRATENLFTCNKCGSVLRYDSVYDKLLCSDRSSCKAVYTYNERKIIQGEQVDEDTIGESIKYSIVMEPGEVSKEIETFEDMLVGDNYYVINTPADLYEYEKMKEEKQMEVTLNGKLITKEDRFDAMVKLAKDPNDEEAKRIVFGPYDEVEVPEPLYTESYEETLERMSGPGFPMYSKTQIYGFDYEEDEEEDGVDVNNMYSLDDLVNMVKEANREKKEKAESFNRRMDDVEQDFVKKKYGPEVVELKENVSVEEKVELNSAIRDAIVSVVNEIKDTKEVTPPDTVEETSGYTIGEVYKGDVPSNIQESRIILNNKEMVTTE